MLEEIFGAELRILREEKGLSQEHLGFECDLHRTFISQLERGKRVPMLRTLCKLANALGMPLSEMIAIIESKAK